MRGVAVGNGSWRGDVGDGGDSGRVGEVGREGNGGHSRGKETKTKAIGMAAQVVKMVAAMVTEACRTDRRVGNLSHPHLP